MDAVDQKLLDFRSMNLSLDDKYLLDSGDAYMTGIQALVRLALSQHRRDQQAGLHTAGFVSGYRGSPLGNFDTALWQAGKHFSSHDVVFRPAVNEDLAATAVWGSQQAGLAGQGKFDGVVGWWYGKGPGADRSGDAFRHANLAGTAEHGGVVALYGDDHSCKSSSIPHQSEHVMIGTGIPIFYPSSVQEILDFGAHAVAMSRAAGIWTSMKLVSEIVETSSSVDVSLARVTPDLVHDLTLPPGGLNIRWPDQSLEQEARLYQYKLPRALAYARANRFNQTVWRASAPRTGIVASGKGYLDTIEALRILGINQSVAREIGLQVYRVGMIWPLEPHGIREFAKGLRELIVVEEKRPVLESQIKDELYGLPDSMRPVVVGKSIQGKGEWSTNIDEAPLISHFELQPEPIALMLSRRLLLQELPEQVRSGIEAAVQKMTARTELLKVEDLADRKAYFCSGCPHNTSTRVPEGSRALGGIGCHFLALMMDRGTETFTQMGGEGASWVGAAPFTREPHVFVNIGDGTYFHSGLLAIRQAVAANVNVTYKILYNDAVGMTGGQPVDGVLSVARLTRQLQAEGVGQTVVVSDEPGLIDTTAEGLAAGVTVRHRDELETVQRELREIKGVTALIFAQTCASEKRRRRKRDAYPDPAIRAYINPEVCEGCGDCSTKSNCLSVEPVQTELGIKRRINQSSCNKDFSCVKGFCPSFVTVDAKSVKVRANAGQIPEGWPQAPEVPALDEPFRIVLGGVGGMGVITIGALIGMAAHIEKKAVRVMDMGGMAQKGGTVYSYVQLATRDDDISATKVAQSMCDLLISADPVVAGHSATLSRLKPEGVAIVNQDGTPTAQFIRSRDWLTPVRTLLSRVKGQLTEGQLLTVPAAQLAVHLLGDAIYANQLLLGMAWQKGLIPLHRESIARAIEMNGASVQKNQEAFRLGCHLASSPDLARDMLGDVHEPTRLETVPEIVQDRVRRLTSYWNGAYARRYQHLIESVQTVLPAELTVTAARELYRVMAYKDEYEVARLLTDAQFRSTLTREFGENVKVTYHLAAPTLSRSDPTQKREYGVWMERLMKGLGKAQFLRETAFDPFSRTEERKLERRWRDQYIALLEELFGNPDLMNTVDVAALLALPEQVRGYGHVKLAALEKAMQQWDAIRESTGRAGLARVESLAA